MQYLHKERFIHRDLAARNCMLDAHLRVKVADFGLARDVYETGGVYEVTPEHWGRRMPLRWMPPESLNGDKFTMEGDVWAYGVTLWELVTRCAVPYGKDTPPELFVAQLRRGVRLPRPVSCPPPLYTEIMRPCWAGNPTQRPPFAQLCIQLPAVIKQLEQMAVQQVQVEIVDETGDWRGQNYGGQPAAVGLDGIYQRPSSGTDSDNGAFTLDLGVLYDRALDVPPAQHAPPTDFAHTQYAN